MLKHLMLRALLLLPFVLTVIDLVSLKFSDLSPFGFWLWIVSCLAIGLSSLFSIKKLISCPFTLTALLIFVVSISLTIISPKNISHESTQQIACSLERMATDKDFGNLSTCFLGYTTRQYFIASLPSMLIGHTQLALNLGTAVYLIIGLLLYASGLRRVLPQDQRGDTLCALALSLLFHVSYFRYHFLSYEQSLYPCCFSLIATGLFLHAVASRKLAWLSLFGLAIFQAIFSYTPSLSLLIPAVIALALYCYREPNYKHKIYTILILFSLLSELIVSYFVRADMKRIVAEDKNINELIKEIIKFLVVPADGAYGLVSKYLATIIVFVFCASVLTFIAKLIKIKFNQLSKEIIFFAIILWSLAVILISCISPGYANPPVPFAIHRATLVFPLLFASIVFWLTITDKFLLLQRIIFSFLFVASVLLGLRSLRVDQNLKFPDERLALINTIKKLNIGYPKPEKVHFIFSQELSIYFGNLYDYALYFMNGNISYEFIELNKDNLTSAKCSNSDICLALELENKCVLCGTIPGISTSPYDLTVGERTYRLSLIKIPSKT